MFKIVLNSKIETFGNLIYCKSYNVETLNGYKVYNFCDCLYFETYKNLPFIDYEEYVDYEEYNDRDSYYIRPIKIKNWVLTYDEICHIAGRNVFKFYVNAYYHNLGKSEYYNYPKTVQKLTRIQNVQYRFLEEVGSDFKSFEVCEDLNFLDYKTKSDYELIFEIELQILQLKIMDLNSKLQSSKVEELKKIEQLKLQDLMLKDLQSTTIKEVENFKWHKKLKFW